MTKPSSGDITFTFVELVLNTTSGRTPLPIAIDGKLPCIEWSYGRNTSSEDSRPSVWSIVDSAAALTTGNLSFLLALCCYFPHIAKQIYIAKEESYAPIVLSGIVKNGTKPPVSTELPIVFQFWTLYTMRGTDEDVPLNVASGADVSVNLLLGNTLLRTSA